VNFLKIRVSVVRNLDPLGGRLTPVAVPGRDRLGTWANGWVSTAPGYGWEYPAFLIAASVVLALLGDGAYTLRRIAIVPSAS
jgi:hypothetical protein